MSTANEVSRPLCVAITGATGFVGNALVSRLEDECAVIALGRRYASSDASSDAPAEQTESVGLGVVRRRCDLFSVGQTERALDGADVAVYLVHSMSPNARLTQGRFEDLDLLLADNFGRAAAKAGVRQIVFLGSLLPEGPKAELSPHLAGRLEVEKALGAYGVPVTAVRAGLVVGAEGSSLNLLVRLVERLPLMVCPTWTLSRTQPIALQDVVDILAHCCFDEETPGRVCEIGGPDVLSYREMMQVTAGVVGRHGPMIPVPFAAPALSELWVSLVTGTSRSLVRPLIESLRHPMVVADPWLQKKMGLEGRSFEDSLRDSLRRSRVWKRPIAHSIQRLRLPQGRDAAWGGEEYSRWLQRIFSGLLRVERNGPLLELGIRGIRDPMLVLRRDESVSDPGRYVLRVIGGALSGTQPKGEPRLEFRTASDGRHLLVALQDFEPRLPWWIYGWSQAPIHVAIMSAYRRFLAKVASAQEGIQNEHEVT
jgi:uncharacterized protein YbjT (DUF2867 family)